MARNGIRDKLVALSGWETYKAKMKHRFDPGPVDASQFNDPAAERVSWEPLAPSGLLYHRRLRQPSRQRCSFNLRWISVAAFLLLPLLLAVLSWLLHVWPVALLMLVIGYPACFVALYLGSVPVVFDKKKGELVKGRWQGREHVPLDEIKALQLISFFYSDGHPRSAGVVYQLNLVRQYNRRMELVTQRVPVPRSAREGVFEDAAQLAGFLGVPLWDAVARHDR